MPKKPNVDPLFEGSVATAPPPPEDDEAAGTDRQGVDKKPAPAATTKDLSSTEINKVLYYSSTQTFFSPQHRPITRECMDHMVERLYAPSSLLERTKLDFKRRRAQQQSTSYDATHDAHLASFWARQQILQQSRREERAARMAEMAAIEEHINSRGGTPLPSPLRITTGSAASSPQRSRLLSCSSDSSSPASLTPRQCKVGKSSQKYLGDLAAFPESAWVLILSNLDSNDKRRLSEASRAVARRMRFVERVESEERRRSPSAHKADSGDVLVRPVNRIYRQDLTAIWMLAKPPPSFQGCVRKFGLRPSDYDLRWLNQAEADTAAPTPSISVFSIPRDVSSDTAGFAVNSPRSVVTMLRNGVELNELLPRPLSQFAAVASLEGASPQIAEMRFLAFENRRKDLLGKVLKDYSAICSAISQAALIKMLYNVRPDDHPDYPIRFDSSPINARSLQDKQFTRKLSIIEKTGMLRQMKAAEMQTHAKAKLEKYLGRAMSLTMKREQDLQAQMDRDAEKARQMELRKKAEREEMHQKNLLMNGKLEAVRAEAKMLERVRREQMETRIAAQDRRWESLKERRAFIKRVEVEESRIATQQQHDDMQRRERILEYRKLLTLDRIRRKMDKAQAALQSDLKLRKTMKEDREAFSMQRKALSEQHESAILSFQRKAEQKSVQRRRAADTSRTPSPIANASPQPTESPPPATQPATDAPQEQQKETNAPAKATESANAPASVQPAAEQETHKKTEVAPPKPEEKREEKKPGAAQKEEQPPQTKPQDPPTVVEAAPPSEEKNNSEKNKSEQPPKEPEPQPPTTTTTTTAEPQRETVAERPPQSEKGEPAAAPTQEKQQPAAAPTQEGQQPSRSAPEPPAQKGQQPAPQPDDAKAARLSPTSPKSARSYSSDDYSSDSSSRSSRSHS